MQIVFRKEVGQALPQHEQAAVELIGTVAMELRITVSLTRGPGRQFDPKTAAAIMKKACNILASGLTWQQVAFFAEMDRQEAMRRLSTSRPAHKYRRSHRARLAVTAFLLQGRRVTLRWRGCEEGGLSCRRSLLRTRFSMIARRGWAYSGGRSATR
jgi:hypothetical protein